MTYLHSLPVCRQFDDLFTRLVHNRAGSALSDTEDDSASSFSHKSIESAGYEYDGYVYDDAIYGYMEEYEN